MRFITLLLTLTLSIAPGALGATYLVNPDGSGDFPTIQAAINVSANGDTILLGDGRFTGNENRDLLIANKTLILRSVSDNPELCTIDCEGSPTDPHRVLEIHLASDVSPVLQGITLENGYAEQDGGAILCSTVGSSAMSLPRFFNCVFRDNHAGGGGSAVALTGSCEDIYTASLEDCHFEQNVAGGKGAVFTGCGPSAIITNSHFFGNQSESGGAIYVGQWNFGTDIGDCTFLENSADNFGGAILVSFDSFPTIHDCSFEANSTGNGGGAISFTNYRAGEGPAELRGTERGSASHCTFLNNSAQKGGAIYAASLQYCVILADCHFEGNTAEDGGAIYHINVGICTLHHSVLVGNLATRGGGVYVEALDESISGFVYSDCTFVANQAIEGGSLYYSGIQDHLALDRTIMAFGQQGGAVYCQGANTPLFRCCDLFGNVGGDWIGCIEQQIEYDGNFSANPCFCDSTTGDFSLCGDSWCLAGNHPWGCDELVGAFGQGCDPCECPGPVRKEKMTLGGIKTLFR